ncbi:MAG: transglutaminase family protein [Acidobacteriota bacterium]
MFALFFAADGHTAPVPSTYAEAVMLFAEIAYGDGDAAELSTALQALATSARRSGVPLRLWFFGAGRFTGERTPDTARRRELLDVVENRRGACLALASVYLLLADDLGEDATAVATPRHVFIRQRINGRLQNVELLEDGRDLPDRSYLEREHVTVDDPRTQGILRPLSPPRFLAYLLNNLAVHLRAEADITGARQLYRRALRLYPDCQPCVYNLANLLAAQQKPRKAERLYARALRLDPWDQEARRNREELRHR